MKRRNVYQTVWIMKDNKPQKMMVYSIIECMNYLKNDVDVFYNFVYGTFVAGFEGCDIHEKVPESRVYDSKEELLESL